MISSVDVAIVGAGQAGLATSWFLSDANVDHVLLEAGRVGETWRSRRWDSFCLVTPNWSVQLPGGNYAGPDPDGFMPLAEIIDHLQGWADGFHAPVEEDTPVSALEQDDGGFLIRLADREIRARTVVVASGAYQRAHRPAGAGQIAAGVEQILAEEYANPSALPPGAVLVVGSGQTGCQLAEEIHESGRKVFLSCGRCPWGPRRFGGRDLVWWLVHTGFSDRTPEKLPSPAARLVGNPQATGHGGGHDLHFRTLHERGIELVGRFVGAEDGKIDFADDLAASVDFGDARLRDLWKYVEDYCSRHGESVPNFEWPAPFRVTARDELDIAREEIGTVIWTSGFRPDYSWVHVPVFDEMGFPVQRDGRSSVPGLYFMGVHWMRKNKSSILYGVGEDAEVVARQIVEDRK